MHLNDYLNSTDPTIFNQNKSTNKRTILSLLQYSSTPDMDSIAWVMLSIGDIQNANAIRKELYQLAAIRDLEGLYDAGSIKNTENPNDARVALRSVLSYFHQKKIAVILIADHADTIATQFTAVSQFSHNTSLLILDSQADLSNQTGNNNYLHPIVSKESGNLFNLALAGYQSYYVDQDTHDTFEKLNFDLIRYGQLRGNVAEIEPYCRGAHQFSMCLSAIRASDAPAQYNPSPNGFSGEDACQIARYAGMSNDIISAAFIGYQASGDTQACTARLSAQMIWYFLEGITQRRPDYPVDNHPDYIKYTSTFRNSNHVVVFYKSLSSNRWWMEVPYPNEKSSSDGKFLVPCSYTDYQTAQNDEVPDRWLKALQKLI